MIRWNVMVQCDREGCDTTKPTLLSYSPVFLLPTPKGQKLVGGSRPPIPDLPPGWKTEEVTDFKTGGKGMRLVCAKCSRRDSAKQKQASDRIEKAAKGER